MAELIRILGSNEISANISVKRYIPVYIIQQFFNVTSIPEAKMILYDEIIEKYTFL